MKKKIKSIKRNLVMIAGTIIVFFLIAIGLLLAYSPGKPKLFLDANGNQLEGSISEKKFMTIGGVKQGMFIRSKNINNPILLYVHGGPAFPNYFLIEKYNPGLEDYFTVCYWEQRGGGLSYSKEVSLKSMNLDQLASDAIEVTEYLRKRFGQEKIFMMAHSGGTPIALLAASRNPQLYEAYIAMAQITDQTESEKIAFNYMLNQYTKTGNRKRIEALKAYKVLESDVNVQSFYRSSIRDQYMHELGIGTMHEMRSVISGVFLPVWACKAYTLGEKINIWKAKFSFLPKTNLIDELLSIDFTSRIDKLDVPVYFLSGKYDMTVNIDMSKEYLLQLNAPRKGFYTFINSAHSPLFEEPAAVRRIIEKDILNQKVSLADESG
jgi:pimeloyl-ACP methyl ester carboxylesterase